MPSSRIMHISTHHTQHRRCQVLYDIGISIDQLALDIPLYLLDLLNEHKFDDFNQ
jgi:hypothetical protein